MLARVGRLFRTVRYLKAVQIVYQIRSRLASASIRGLTDEDHPVYSLTLIPLPRIKTVITSGNTFTFLNLSKKFHDMTVDWDFQDYGKLWNYNLQYLDYLHQQDLSEQYRIALAKDLYRSVSENRLKPEPYPVSLRTINVIRFLNLIAGDSPDTEILRNYLYSELDYLHNNYEYHLLGNHLLENAFAMLMGGHFFGHDGWKDKAVSVLNAELAEQILPDGAHFELSPMYHQIILWRVLEAIGYLSPDTAIYRVLSEKALSMLGWLHKISFRTGEIPHFNDSTDGIAFTTSELLDAARKLGLEPVEICLSDSGYRRFDHLGYELIADVQGIKPDYQPGHSHADHLSFVMQADHKPFIVDSGTSTYSISPKRSWERSSVAHNTITINNQDQSEMWGGFRVGRRAEIKIVSDTDLGVKAELSYKIPGQDIRHTRSFSLTDRSIDIEDSLNTDAEATSRFHLHPDVGIISIQDSEVRFNNGIIVKFDNAADISTEQYEFAQGFNLLQTASVLKVSFRKTLRCVITTI